MRVLRQIRVTNTNDLQARYPYKEVAVLSLLLWRHHAPHVSTLLRIVHTEPALR